MIQMCKIKGNINNLKNLNLKMESMLKWITPNNVELVMLYSRKIPNRCLNGLKTSHEKNKK